MRILEIGKITLCTKRLDIIQNRVADMEANERSEVFPIIQKNCMIKKREGFTLVELIVVLVILAILAAVLVWSLMGYVNKAKQTEYLIKAHNAVEAAQCIIMEEYADGASFDTWRGFSNITDRNTEIQGRIYALCEIDKNEFIIANVDVNTEGQLIFLNLYSRKTINGKPNRIVYINGTIGGKTYNGEFIVSCWNGVEQYTYRSLDPAWAGYKKE